jgi:chromosome segregation ATPase|tara:strand:+ start:501 stop:785 length:285 start_codon:yes stop_codon:yes gene_type:complete
MAKKSTEIKFTQNELDNLTDLRNNYDSIRSSMGNLELSKLQLESRLSDLEEEKFRLEAEYTNLIKREQELVGELNEKYGAGNLDPATGIFTPNK